MGISPIVINASVLNIFAMTLDALHVQAIYSGTRLLTRMEDLKLWGIFSKIRNLLIGDKMKISVLIEKLTRIHKEKGDIEAVDPFLTPIKDVIVYGDELDDEDVAMIVS